MGNCYRETDLLMTEVALVSDPVSRYLPHKVKPPVLKTVAGSNLQSKCTVLYNINKQ